jgi:hypothetical protein
MPIVEALMDGNRGRQFRNGGGEHGPAIEFYCGGRYFAVTDDTIGDSDDLRQVGIGDLTWLLREAGPRFAGKDREAARGGKPFSHFWRSKDGDFPCTPTGVEHRNDSDGRIYARVVTPDGIERARRSRSPRQHGSIATSRSNK